MPRYDYKCQSCDHLFEGISRVSAPNPPCSKCESPTRKVILTAPRIKVQSDWHGEMARAQRKMRQDPVPVGSTVEDIPRLMAEAEQNK